MQQQRQQKQRQQHHQQLIQRLQRGRQLCSFSLIVYTICSLLISSSSNTTTGSSSGSSTFADAAEIAVAAAAAASIGAKLAEEQTRLNNVVPKSELSEITEETRDSLTAPPTPPTPPTPPQAQTTDGGGQYIASTENILTPQGEVALDYKTAGSGGGGGAAAAKLPEELNDGELEGGDRHISWNYSDQSSWFGEYPQCRSNNLRQSPIDIVTDQIIFMPRMSLQFVDYNQEVEFELKNTHHSVSLTPISSLATPSLKINWIGSQDELYELQEIHFHWGDGKNKGSEHEINDKRAAAEMHMVHYRKGLNKDQIGSVENSVVVIGVLIESDSIEHNKLESLVERSSNVNGTDLEYKDGNPQNLIHLLPDNHHSFYTYEGSLTTPPCYEVVTWIIMSEPVFMCQAKLVELANLEANKPGLGRQKINSNHRDIQPLLNRPVYASFNATDTSTYELTSDFHMKEIGQHDTIRLHALDRYWAHVNSLKVSVKKAHKYLEDARKKLWATLRGNQDNATMKKKKIREQNMQQQQPPVE